METKIAGDSEPIVCHTYDDDFVYDSSNPAFKGQKVLQIYQDKSANEFIYDKKGLLITKRFYPDNRVNQNYDTTTYTYDVYGRIKTRVVNGTVKETNEYHVNGEISNRVVSGITETYAYDTKQRVSQISSTYDNQVTDIEYDSNDRVNRISSDGIILETEYDCLNRITKTDLVKSNQDIITNTLEYLTTEDGPTPLVREHTQYIKGLREDIFNYTYDKVGNITKILSDDTKTRYTYDKVDRLIREDNEQLQRTYMFSYDSGGNITSKKEYAYSLNDEPFNYLGKNTFQYALTGHKDRLMKTNINHEVVDVIYDEMDRPTSYKGKTLIWNKQGTLSTYGELTFEYDENGIRTKKGDKTFTVIGTKILEQTEGTNSLKPIYLLDKMMGFEYNNVKYMYSKNIQGDIIGIYDEAGNLIARYVYDAWGNHKVLDSNGSEDVNETFIGNINPFRYRGYFFDSETGLYYLNARYYDPIIGRFISPDSISILNETMMDANGLNLYMYCANNPVMYTDSTGHFAITLTFLTWAAVALFGLATVGYIESQFHPIQTTFELIGQGLGWLGTQAWNGLQWVFSQWEPGTWPGDDPTVAPGDDFIWRGPGDVGSNCGEWYNPKTGDQLHPDLFHKPPKKPHWGWRNKIRKILRDIFKKGPPGPPTLT